jgi:uncharacterized protein (TIGR04141 family)
MPGRRLPLTLYLLRSGVTPLRAVRIPSQARPSDEDEATSEPTADAQASGWVRTWVQEADGFIEAALPDRSGAATSLLVRASPGESDWQDFIFSLLPDDRYRGTPFIYGGLLFQPIEEHIAVWSFGTGWTLLQPGAVVDRFGLHAGLNALLSSSLLPGARPKQTGVKSLTSAVRANVVRRNSVTAARPASPTTMERVDRASDAAQSAEVATHHPIFTSVRAGRSLHFEAPVSSLADLESYATEALRLYHRSDYKGDSNYNWIDYTVPVTDPAEIDQVLDAVLAQARGSAPLQVDLMWADTDRVRNLTPSYVCFPREHSTPKAAKRTDMQWPAALHWLDGNLPGVPGHDSLRSGMRFYHDDNTLAVEADLWELMVTQVAVGGETYMVSDGEVWRVSSSFIKNIDDQLARVVQVNPSWLPPFKAGEPEGDYNKRAAIHGGHFLLDKTLVRIPGQTTFEPCDLLSADGQLMHVKRKSSASAISHIGTQAIAATRLLREDAAARELLDDALRKYRPAPRRMADMRKHCKSFEGRPTGKVELVIVGQWRGVPDVTQLSLLTRISLNSWLREITCQAGVVLVGT